MAIVTKRFRDNVARRPLHQLFIPKSCRNPHTNTLTRIQCVCVSPLPTASVRSCSYYKAASTSFTLLAAVSAKHDFYSTQLCLEDAQQMRFFLFPVLFIKKQTILSDTVLSGLESKYQLIY